MKWKRSEFTANLNPNFGSGERREAGAKPVGRQCVKPVSEFERAGFADQTPAGEKTVFNCTTALKAYLGQNREEDFMTILGLGGLLDDAACAVLKNGDTEGCCRRRGQVDARVSPGHTSLSLRGRMLAGGRLHAPGSRRHRPVRPFALGTEPDFHLDLREQFPRAKSRGSTKPTPGFRQLFCRPSNTPRWR